MGFAFIAPKKIATEIVNLINTQQFEDGAIQAQIVGEVGKLGGSEKELRTTLHKPYEGGKLDFVGYAN